MMQQLAISLWRKSRFACCISCVYDSPVTSRLDYPRPPPHTHASGEVEADENAAATPPTVCRAMGMPGVSGSCHNSNSATGKKIKNDWAISSKGSGFGTPPHYHESPGVHMGVPSARVQAQRE